MINVSNDFKTRTKKIKQQNIKLSIVDGELTVKEVHFMPVKQFNALPVWMLRAREKVIAKELKYSFEGNLFKTIMKQIEITVKNAGELKDKNVNFQYGIYVNNDFEYIDLGDYYIKDVEDDKGKTELVVTGYDKMIHFMKTFKQSELQLTYPCRMLALIQKMCEVCGVGLYSTNFFNADLQVDEDYFTAQELTYRDVLEKIAETTETTIFIKDNKLYLHKLTNSPVEKLDASYLAELTVKEKFGPVNALVLGRGEVEDNIEAKDDTSISKNGRCEIRFDENEFIEYQRKTVIDRMFEQIKELEYYAFEGSDIGVMWLEPGDLIEVEDTEQSKYKTIYLKANIIINTGINSDIGADIPTETNTEYKVTTKEEKKTLKVQRLAKKNEGLIQDLIQETTEQGQKLTEVKQTVDGIEQTVSSVETKIETVENKADNAQSTANNATQKAENAQTNANSAQDTANTANNNAQKAQDTANNINNNLSQNYYTKTETNSQIKQKADSITQSVSKTYSTKTETTNAKNEAINSANASTDKKLEDYTVTEQLGTVIEQNWEHIKIAWNQISEFIQMMIINGNASFAILDESKSILMSLDKEGQHFYKNNKTPFGEMGVNTINNQNYISFGIMGDYGQQIADGMAWGITTQTDNKFWPILYIKNFSMGEKDSDTSYGELVLSSCNLVLDGIGTGIKTGGVLINGDPSGFGLYFWDENTHKVLLTISPPNSFEDAYISILDNIKFFRNEAGSNSFMLGAGNNYCLLSDNGYMRGNELYVVGDGTFLGDFNCEGNLYASKNITCYGNIDCRGNIYAANISSDKRLKKNIKNAKDGAIEILNKIQVKSFDWKEDNVHTNYGFIAQELEEIDGNYVLKQKVEDKNIDYKYYVNELPILATLVKSVQENYIIIKELKEKEQQKNEIIAELMSRIEKLEEANYERNEKPKII